MAVFVRGGRNKNFRLFSVLRVYIYWYIKNIRIPVVSSISMVCLLPVPGIDSTRILRCSDSARSVSVSSQGKVLIRKCQVKARY